MIGYIMTDPNMIDPKMMSRKRFFAKEEQFLCRQRRQMLQRTEY